MQIAAANLHLQHRHKNAIFNTFGLIAFTTSLWNPDLDNCLTKFALLSALNTFLDVKTTMIYTHVLNGVGVGCGVHWIGEALRRDFEPLWRVSEIIWRDFGTRWRVSELV